jgi:putative iron-regulated protein
MIKNTKILLTSISLATVLVLVGCTTSTNNMNKIHTDSLKSNSLLHTYANIALTNYTDALNDAKSLKIAIDNFAILPSPKTMNLAKEAWLKSRESYGQTEIFRLSNGPIDAEDGWVANTYGALEGQLNAWPLDESMIDYTRNANGYKTSGNIIDSTGAFNPGGEGSTAINIDTITVEAISALNENGGDANVATGYHAVEFLLWGQDQDYNNFLKDSVSKGALQAGNRPLTDFTSDKNAPRRLSYLKVSASKIILDLETVKNAWNVDLSNNNGLYRQAFLGLGKNAISKKVAMQQVFSGMGVFIKSELANERIAVAVLTPSEEDEHSCFSDNTHRDIATNYQGFKNILMGTYEDKSFGKAPFDALDESYKHKVSKMMHSIEDKIFSINTIAKTSRHFDYQIRPNDPQSKVIVKLKNEMRKLGDMMVEVSKANGVDLNIEDITDSDETQL